MAGRDTDPERLIEDSETYLNDELTPEAIERLMDAALTDELLREFGYSDVAYLVIGNFDEPQKARLRSVRNELADRGASQFAFLLDEIGDQVWENFVVKFKIFAARVDFVVGVFEDNEGGHELELAELDRERYQQKTRVFKQDYLTVKAERSAYDAMLAHLFEIMDNRGQLYRWETEEELLELVAEHVPASRPP
ncbi:hypothetical protein [Halococcus salifodinae]|uniref:Uncharacterized protein n=1 Tax=Halococcus salifodinae DSM 8989 TaxID=1227456 RepID=M0ND78_9EURY|nr:hypothetical protein [Halococcus salifodinae]EMA54640.1 hypothetical protein C450_05080 [Halococcus salifodinae DSM 8989]